MRAIILITLLISLCSFGQDTTVIRLPFIQDEQPIITNKYDANYPNNLYYISLNRYKIIIPLDFKFRKNYFFYNEKKRTYKIYY